MKAFCLRVLIICGLLTSIQPLTGQVPGVKQGTALDLILIVDTSATMAGKAGGQNIFPEVKRVLRELIDSTQAGDNVVLIPYEANVQAYPTTLINDERDKQRLKVLVDRLSAQGKWTYTAAAIEAGLAEAKRLEDAQGASQHTKAVVLLTDGINDPPPEVRGTAAEVRLEDVARRFAGMPWFVWQVQLGPQLDESVDRAFRGRLPNYNAVQTPAARLHQVREQVLKEVAAERERQQAKEEARRKQQDAAEAEARKKAEEAARRQREKAERWARTRRLLATLGLVGGAVVLLLAIWVWYRRRPRPHGTLTYWRKGEPPRSLDLAASRRLRLRIGGPGSDLVLAGFDAKGATVRAERVEGEILCVIEADDGVSMKFRGNPVGRLELHDLDEFQLGDYTLRYRGEVSARPR